MVVFKKVADLQAFIREIKKTGKRIGFVPTMGALHSGHTSLVEASKAATDVTVASIFVNPTQFNQATDLAKYPRTPGPDMHILIEAGCDVLFMPETEEVYPPGLDVALHGIRFGQLEQVMEGVFRPGHFEGMATVVNRLLEIVLPHQLFMGQKDYQQLSIVRDLLKQTRKKVKLVMCPTIREDDGLAKSSRNVRLSPKMRAIAPVIYQSLVQAKQSLGSKPIAEIEQLAMSLYADAGLRPEYFEIVDGITLQKVSQPKNHKLIVACMAAWAEEVRLIDNLVLKGDV
jgi:pantoate--beta-alanine ligase